MDSFYNEVNDWLLVGGDLLIAEHLTGMDELETIAHLIGEGVTHVIDARSEWTDLTAWIAGGMPTANYCYAPIIDQWDHQPPEDWYVKVETFVRNFLENRSEGDRLYVHCHMGVNRGPSAAMLALLTADPSLSPWDAFLAIREARTIAGVVYAEYVGLRHLVRANLGDDDALYRDLGEFRDRMEDYWNPERIGQVNRGIAYYRGKERSTLVM